MDQLKKLAKLDKAEAKKKEFIHLIDNLYIVLTPIGGDFPDQKPYIENLFSNSVLKQKNNGKSFDPHLKKMKTQKPLAKAYLPTKSSHLMQKILTFQTLI